MLSSQILCKSYQIWKIQVFWAANTMSMGESFLASQTIIVHLKCVVSTCQTTYSHVPQHLDLQQHHCEEAQISPLNVVWRQSSSQMWCHAIWNMCLSYQRNLLPVIIITVEDKIIITDDDDDDGSSRFLWKLGHIPGCMAPHLRKWFVHSHQHKEFE